MAGVNADARAGRTDMGACAHAMVTDARTGTDRSNMRTGAHAVAARMYPGANAQDINAHADILGIGRA